MKRLYFLLLFLTVSASAQIVNIPDAAFKNTLVNLPCVDTDFDGEGDADADLDNDGEISQAEADLVEFLVVSNKNIASLEGIAAFTQMIYLDCSLNVLTSLDVSANPGLLTLICQGNMLTSLNLPQVPIGDDEFRNVNAAGNFLNTIDLKNARYEGLNLSANQLTAVDMSQTPQIYEFNLQNNQLISFAMPASLQINELYLDSNPLLSFSIPPTGFETLSISDTQLEILDLGNLLDIAFMLSINDNPNLMWINLANGNFEGEPGNSVLGLDNNPSLQTVCIDDLGYTIDEGGNLIEVSEYISVTSAVGLGVNVTTYCNLNPPSGYNTVSGVVRYDIGSDGCSPTNPPAAFVRIDVTYSQGVASRYTNQAGEYSFFTQEESVALQPIVDAGLFVPFTPVTVDFGPDGDQAETQDFCIAGQGAVNDLEVAIATIIPARPGFEAVYRLTYHNKGNQVMTQAEGVTFSFDNTRMTLQQTSVTPTAQSPGNLAWDFANLTPFESRSIDITMLINAPIDAVAVNIGDVLPFSAFILPLAGDAMVNDNTFSLNQVAVGSYDPNDKNCLQGNSVSTTAIGDYLHYVINFENTGTFVAQNVVVKDLINLDMFDLSTLQILDASHSVQTQVRENKVEFIFQGINLEIGGHGNILLKIKTLNTLVEGDTVENEANIYFDYNHPVLTDTAVTLFESLKVDEVSGVAMSVWPNPSAGIINLKSASAITKMELYDVQGRLLLVRSGNSAQESIDLSPRTNGIYILRVTTPEGIGHVKLVRN